MNDQIIFQKDVDESILIAGMTIPSIFQNLFFEKIGFRLKKGESRDINILIGDTLYLAKLNNNDFDENKYKNHTEVLQIRYTKNSPLAKRFREIFSSTWAITQELRPSLEKHKNIKIPIDKKEFIGIYSTPVCGTIMIDCIPLADCQNEIRDISLQNEKDFEAYINQKDPEATLQTKVTIRKIRHLSKAIGDNLKQVYGYRCQICGEYIGEKYGSFLVHAHHINYFTKSLDNDAKNIMIVCPNHHGIIHDCNPKFNFHKKIFKYPNGYEEGLKINFHL